ncbi:hypothetical protein BH10ACT1_BH10ACT1_16910 [soil metagenome]
MEPSGIDAYRLGRAYAVMPIDMVPEACVDVAAGPITFVVESRRLTDEAIIASAEEQGRRDAIDEPDGLDDGGASLHVLATADRLEHLRFDCFENEPHYHYIRNAESSNVVVRIDTFAVGDPRAWALSCVRERLPEMLEHAGATDLADQVRSHPVSALSAALARIEALLDAAAAVP